MEYGTIFFNSTRAEGTFTKSLSDDLKDKYVEYVNNLLTLTETNQGTYYDYLKSIIEESLNNFLSDTTFPYNPSSSNKGGMNGGGPGGDPPNGGQGQQPLIEDQQGEFSPSDIQEEGGYQIKSKKGGDTPSGDGTNTNSGATYETASDYIASLNSDKVWINYDSSKNKYTIQVLKIL